MLTQNFWKNKKIFITGHTGFKGAWLTLILNRLGAKTLGYSLEAPTSPSLFALCNISKTTQSIIADIRDLNNLEQVMLSFEPEIVLHLAAQALVRRSYKDPLETYTTNIIGTANLFETIRKTQSVKAVVNVTSDKCYENMEWDRPYTEEDRFGGFDPYSSSKACSEIITASYRNSFFSNTKVALASARAGNVIGGGDFSEDRLLPDFFRAIQKDKALIIRNPNATRPWQHVFEPLYGYLLLAKNLFEKNSTFTEGWNFGPLNDDAKPVSFIADYICKKWGNNSSYIISNNKEPHEAKLLKLDATKARTRLNWKNHLNIQAALDLTIDWWKAYFNKEDILKVSLNQINEYLDKTQNG